MVATNNYHIFILVIPPSHDAPYNTPHKVIVAAHLSTDFLFRYQEVLTVSVFTALSFFLLFLSFIQVTLVALEHDQEQQRQVHSDAVVSVNYATEKRPSIS